MRLKTRWATALCLAGIVAGGVGATAAQGYILRAHGHVYGILPAPGSQAMRRASVAAGQDVSYQGGPVMLTNRIFLIFWGPANSFAASYENPIIQWVQGLAADSGKTTNEFSVGSLYYQNNPHAYISRTVTFGGGVNDNRTYPANGCENPANSRGVCLSDGELQTEIAYVIRAEHWPTDRPRAPKDQYLIFTPNGVDSCQDRTETSCTFASKNAYCAYHGSFMMGSNAVVYSNLPYESGCDSGQAPSGVQGNADTDGTLDSGIHEVLESATDPNSTRSYNPAWITQQGYEIGDECDEPPQQNEFGVYGAPLGGSLTADTAFNQVIGSRTYYTQEIWALGTRLRASQGCAQRIGPTPQFSMSSGPDYAGQPISFNGAGSYDLGRPITQYQWNYGDGTVSTSARGSHTYTQPGVYQVSLTVSDAGGAGNASTQTQTVEVH